MEFRDTDSCQRKRSSWKPKVCYPASNPRLHTDGRANDSTIRQGHIVAVDSKSHPYTVLITLCSCYNIIICHTFLCFFKFSERLGEKMLDFLYKQKHKITETFIHSFCHLRSKNKSSTGCLPPPRDVCKVLPLSSHGSAEAFCHHPCPGRPHEAWAVFRIASSLLLVTR